MYSGKLEKGSLLPNFAKASEKWDLFDDILEGLVKFGSILKRPVPL
jgi:hypothetical protein